MKDPIVLIYYKYAQIPRPRDLMIQQRALCSELGLRGRILVAQEGINATLEGESQKVEQYCQILDTHPQLSGARFKRSQGNGNAFPKLVVKVRKEIVTGSLGREDVDPNIISGDYITADQLHDWFVAGKKFKIVDMRNDYEQILGMFEGSIPSGMQNFRDLKKTAEQLKDLENETIVTVCTSGVRCEKASGYLKSKGYKKVYQLEDGIASYMERYPNQHFKGKLYVFDGRIMIGFGQSRQQVIYGKCALCNSPSENYTNCAFYDCHKHFICCDGCLRNGLPFCKSECQQEYAGAGPGSRLADC